VNYCIILQFAEDCVNFFTAVIAGVGCCYSQNGWLRVWYYKGVWWWGSVIDRDMWWGTRCVGVFLVRNVERLENYLCRPNWFKKSQLFTSVTPTCTPKVTKPVHYHTSCPLSTYYVQCMLIPDRLTWEWTKAFAFRGWCLSACVSLLFCVLLNLIAVIKNHLSLGTHRLITKYR
jgi:hypothetical protein